MRIDLLPGTGNVVRFPAERRARPTLSLLREIAPDPRQVGLAADLHGIPHPVADLRDDTDAATAGHIRDHVLSGPGDARQAALRALLEPQLAQAVAACWDARDALAAAGDVWRAVERAQAAGSPHAEAMEQEAAELSRHAAELAVQADLCSQEVEGIARAVRVAERGEAWMPADRDAEFAESFGLAQPA